MKNSIYQAALAGLLCLGAALPALCEPNDMGTLHLKRDEKIQGTFQGFHMGQVMLKTDSGQNVELPSMALFFGTDPRVHMSELQVGQPLSVTLPEHTAVRILYRNDSGTALTLGDYDGVAVIPQAVLTTWKTEPSLSAADR